jgi:ketosteroid isomerase-like protein
VGGQAEQIVRRHAEIINSSESVDEVMAAMEPLLDPDIEFVNPKDAIERGTRKGLAGMRTATESFIAGAGTGVTVELMELDDRDDRVFIIGRLHARGESSGAEALGPPVGMIYTIRDGLILRIEWHYDVDEARADFEQGLTD